MPRPRSNPLALSQPRPAASAPESSRPSAKPFSERLCDVTPMISSVLLTDLYELTMLQAYFAERMNGTAVFELFVRKLPSQRNFLVAAGLAEVVDYLASLAFADDELAWLAGTGRFTPAFVESLRTLRFTGDVDAVPEGTVLVA